MASYNSRELLLLSIALLFLIIIPSATSISFEFPKFNRNTSEISLQGNATISKGAIQVTGYPLSRSRIGLASYTKLVPLWDRETRKLTDFTTHFYFNISPNQYFYGDRLAFFFAPRDSSLPLNPTTILRSEIYNFASNGYIYNSTSNGNNYNSTSNGYIYNSTSNGGIYNSTSNGENYNSISNGTDNQIFAIDFIAVNTSCESSVVNNSGTYSVEVCVPYDSSTIAGGRKANVWISYNSSNQNLSIFFTYAANPIFHGNSTLSYPIDLRKYLPDQVNVGFAASMGTNVVSLSVLSWEFNSTLNIPARDELRKMLLMVAIPAGGGIAVIGIVLFILPKNRNGTRKEGSSLPDG
ncbi:hypothetical protein NE237_031412 [Protea cynaroides]|uniref:Legume lectin domain-containing protein n=1 Tax=Protea cynaroides TaxID=273540 RepID=A0A9Q0R236_9MAGN|nr:hypothetical protein NE237_031412 [Protea cynaroides]